MERYVGVDAHAQGCTLGVMSASGRRLRELLVRRTGGRWSMRFEGSAVACMCAWKGVR